MDATEEPALRRIRAGVLEVAYRQYGPDDGTPVVLLHGFPYDVEAYAEVGPLLGQAGCRAIVPYLRGFGPTRFLDPATPRSGEQAVLGHDLLTLLDALGLPQALLAGYDWGGRAACIVAALWPARCAGLVSVNGYNLQHIARSGQPETPEVERRLWYQYYFHSERGRAGLAQHRRAFCQLLWQLWSPTWRFGDAEYARSAVAFDNPDFVDVVIHSYRHRYGLVPGDPAVAAVEAQLARQPVIEVPTIVLEGDADGVAGPPSADGHRNRFGARFERRIVTGAGHNLPQERPRAFADAVLALRAPPTPRPTDPSPR